MKLKILTVGKLSLKQVQILAQDYTERIGHYLPIEFISAKTLKDSFSQIKNEDCLVVLDERGRSLGSVEFAKWLEDKKIHAVKSLVFLIGPAEGFSEEVRKKADLVLSLSKMTLQHELALVILLEQIYRTCTILKGEPYHKK